MFTQLKVHALTKRFVLVGMAFILVMGVSGFRVLGATSSFENFALPSRTGGVAVPKTDRSYKTARFSLEGRIKIKEPGFNHQQYVFAKEAFLAEKREEAIKLLRQQIDAGYTQNLANMLLRLGQLYAEKYMELSYFENRVFGEKLKKYEEERAANPKAVAPKLGNQRSQGYLKDALKIFYELEKKYPKHPKLDEVVYFIGFVEMESGNGKKGTLYLERLIRKYPGSRKYDEAIVYLGDYYFEKHDFKTAAARFSILFKRKDATLNNYATYKISWCHLNTGRKELGLGQMKKLIKYLEGTQEKANFNLREQALRDLVIFYGEIGAVDDAYSFYMEHQSKSEALKNVRLIADILRSKAHDSQALQAYRLLLREGPRNLDAPNIEMGIFESLMRLGNSKEAAGQMNHMLSTYGPGSEFARSYPGGKTDELKQVHEMLESESYKLATFHHSAAQKGTNRAHLDYALSLYGSILKVIPDHPEKKKMMFYRAEILYSQQKWLASADAYMATSKIPPKDKTTDESVYNALLALDNLTFKKSKLERYTIEKVKADELGEKEIPEEERKFVDVAEYYLKEYPKTDRVVDVRFRIASIYYQYHHFDKALEGFRFIAVQYPTHRSAKTCAHLVLDIHNMKKDYESLDSAANQFAKTEGLGDKAFKDEVQKIRNEIRFKKIEKLESQNQWAEAGKAYLEVYRENPKGDLAEKSLHNAVVSWEKTDNRVETEKVVRIFLDKYSSSSQAERLNLKLARDAEARYDFLEAQKLYEKFYIRYPKSKETRKAVYNSAVFAELLEMNRDALSLYQKYLVLGGVTSEEQKSIQISQAKIQRKLGNWSEVNRIYRRLMAQSRTATEKMGILGDLAWLFERFGRVGDKEQAVKEIYWFYRNNKDVKLSGQALRYAVGMMFREVDGLRNQYDKIQLRFPPKDLIYLLKQKQKKMTRLQKAYDDVIGAGVPEWGVAAIYEKARAYNQFVARYRGLRIPAKYKDEQRKQIEQELKVIDKEVIQPVEEKSREVYKACVDKAVEFFVVSDYAKKCMGEHYPQAKVPVPSGLIPQPSYWSVRPMGSEVVLR